MAWWNRQPIEWSREQSERLFAENRLLPDDASTRQTKSAITIGYHKGLFESIILYVLFPAGPICAVAVGVVWVLVETSVLRENAFMPLVLVISGLYLFAASIATLYAWVRWKSRRGDISIRFENGDLDVFGSIFQSVKPTKICLIFGISNDPGRSRQTVTKLRPCNTRNRSRRGNPTLFMGRHNVLRRTQFGEEARETPTHTGRGIQNIWTRETDKQRGYCEAY